MSLDAIQTALVAWVIALTGVEAPFVGFKDDARANVVTKGTSVDLSWVSDVGVGQDEIRYEEDDAAAIPDPNLTPVQMGNRLMVLQVGIETWDQRATVNAHTLANRLRGRVKLPSSLAALAAANVALVDIGGAINANYNSDGRIVSRRVIEIRLNATSTERGTTADQIGSIESVEVTSDKITDSTGDIALDDSLQITNEVMP